MIAPASMSTDQETSFADRHTFVESELRKVSFAWLRPDGCVVPVEPYRHDRYAESIGSDGSRLLKRGWVRLIKGHWMDHRVTQAQLDSIWDWYKSRGDSFVVADWDVI